VKFEYGEAYGVTSVVDMAHVKVLSKWRSRVARDVKIVCIEVEMWWLNIVVGVEDVVVNLRRLKEVRSKSDQAKSVRKPMPKQ